MIHAPEEIMVSGYNQTDRFHVPLRCANDMPAHVKGDAQWIEKAEIFNYHICDADGGEWPIAFFNNDWWLIKIENGECFS
jgi:hypothetical protein